MVITPVNSQTAKSQPRRADIAGNLGGNDEDARADHGAGHEHRGVEQAQLLLESGSSRVRRCVTWAFVRSRASTLMQLAPSLSMPAGETPCLLISPRSSLPRMLWRRP